MQKLSPIFFRIVFTDYLTQNFFVMIFAGWVIYGIDAVFGGRATFFLAVFAATLTPIGLLAFFWRYRLITSALINGTELEGKITKISLIAKDLLLYYDYNFNGQKYQYRNRVKQNTYAKTLKQGQQVTLMAHTKTPRIAFIKEIYLEYI